MSKTKIESTPQKNNSRAEAILMESKVLERDAKIKIAVVATLCSFGLFAPATVPYIGWQAYKKHEERTQMNM